MVEPVYALPSGSDGQYNALVEQLTPEQRALVADLVQRERQAVIGSLLSFMDWKKYRLSLDGIELATEPFGTASDYDLVARLEGDPWPDSDDNDGELDSAEE